MADVTFPVRLPNGNIIENVPEGASKEEIKAKAIKSGLATEEDFKEQVPASEIQSVLNPNFVSRPRGAFGLQETGGLVGGIAGGILGAPLGPVGALAGSAIGAGLGGAAGEVGEQLSKNEPLSPALMARAGVEEAAWDLGGNLVLKGLGKTIRIGADKLGFGQNNIPDANKAAQEFLRQNGSQLSIGQRTGSGIMDALEGLVNTPVTADIFRRKEQEIKNALSSGNKNILKNLVNSPEFDQALRSGSSAQKASGEVLQNFIKEGEQSLSKAVDPEYKAIFADKDSRVSMFSIRQWADKLLSEPVALTAGQRSILKEMQNLPPQVDVNLLHRMRSRWLAENRDKYSSLGTEKDSAASSTISDVIKKFDEAMDFSASKTLDPNTLARYRNVTRTYREGIQGLQTEAVRQALAKNPEEVGSYLFAAGKETPINELYKSIAAAGNLTKKDPKQVLDALRYGYLQAMTNTPENMLNFAKTLERDQATRNTFNSLFSDVKQRQAIEAMNRAAELGLVEPAAKMGLNLQTVSTLKQAAGLGTAAATGYVFFLPPDLQQKVKENAGSLALSATGLVLSQRQLAKALLDPKGAQAITLLSRAKQQALSPTAFTKVVVEPLANILTEESPSQGIPSPQEFSLRTLTPVR